MDKDTIYREAAIDAVRDYPDDLISQLTAIEDLPSAQPEWKRGRWVDDCSCSICHWIHENDNGFALLTDYNFCPNCGADMRERRTDGEQSD